MTMGRLSVERNYELSNALKFNDNKAEFYHHLFLYSGLVQTQEAGEIVWFVFKWTIILKHFRNN